ncbi:cell division cycle protein 48 [Naegleria gruberi]|uniref:Cell division cycle protein 48 n=1 Tax=Naegleria gruberi TaxID=5762 RepID=D2UYV1_NAEGR|nr:cell division cycle protein 48 [Naegleria gruberi]EFC50033.1 cell division cycle protein 48 [Naegleria gruberi]|eukprot:XP_002682777.1 cell division cycle protein 48 [Naegleria gruberi strain NEG-M]
MTEKARAIKRAFVIEEEKSLSSEESIVWLDEDTLNQYKLIIDQYTTISLDYVSSTSGEKLKIKIYAKIKLDRNIIAKQAKISKYLYEEFMNRIVKAFPNDNVNISDQQLLVFISGQVNREDALVANELKLIFHSVEKLDNSPIIDTILSNRTLVKDLVLMNSDRFKLCYQSNLFYTFNILELKFRFRFVGFNSSEELTIFKINNTTKFNIQRHQEQQQECGTTIEHDDSLQDISFEKLVKKITNNPDIPIYHDVIAELIYYILNERSHILITGEGGVGKTFLVNYTLEKLSELVKQTHFEKIFISATDMFQSGLGESENALKSLLLSAPRIDGKEMKKEIIKLVVIDDIDNMLTSDSRYESGRIDRSLISELVHFFDIQALQNRKSNMKTIIIGITSNVDRIDGSLIRVNRLEKEIEMKVPSPNQRLSILRYLMKKFDLNESDGNIKSCQLDTQGFVWADFVKLQSLLDIEKMEIGKLNFDSLKKSISRTKPKTYYQEKPSEDSELTDNFSENLAGIDKIIDQVKLSVIYPFLRYDKYVDIGVQVPKGMLIYGPNGVGKSTLAMCIARECKANFISVQCPDILSKVVGESSRAIKQLFVTARNCAPCILFFDQFDSIARSRNDESGGSSSDKMLSTLLIEMDGVHQHYKKTSLADDEMAQNDNIFILAATNRIDLLDSAVLRPGRIDQHIYLPLPDEESRIEILLLKTNGMPIKDSENCIDEMAKRTSGFSGADLDNLCREAAILCLRENMQNEFIEKSHFEKALQSITKIKPNLN